MNLPEALARFLSGNVELCGELATYEFTTGISGPAIFTEEDGIPEDAGRPAVYIAQVGAVPWGCREQRGGEFSLDISLWGNRESGSALYETAMKVWRAVDRADLCPFLDGWAEWGCVADPPIKIGDAEGFPGYVVRVLCRVMEP